MLAQEITPIHGLPAESFRGIHVLSDDECWVSGTHNTIAHTQDGGVTWSVFSVGLEHGSQDFRDIHAWKGGKAIAMGITAPACMYRTTDYGATWQRTFVDTALFLDAMDFKDHQHGVAVADAVDGRWVILETHDGGETWQRLSPAQSPQARSGDAGFAASGQMLQWIDNRHYAFVYGGINGSGQWKRDIRRGSWSLINLPLMRSTSAGAFTFLTLDQRRTWIFGGDFGQPYKSDSTLAMLRDGNVMLIAQTGGYRCGVDRNYRGLWISTGDMGTSYSLDGLVWKTLGFEGYFTVGLGRQKGYLVGRKGKAARIDLVKIKRLAH